MEMTGAKILMECLLEQGSTWCSAIPAAPS